MDCGDRPRTKAEHPKQAEIEVASFRDISVMAMQFHRAECSSRGTRLAVRSAMSVRTEPTLSARSPRLMKELRNTLKRLHYSPRTSDAYAGWVRQYIAFHGLRHPRDLGRPEIETFLTYLAVRKNVSASTQNQALSAVLFLYRRVLGEGVEWIEAPERVRRPKRLPVVLTRQETGKVLSAMNGVPRLVARLLYGSGLRLLEALTLRVKDIDFGRNDILIRNAKDRRTGTLYFRKVWAGISRRICNTFGKSTKVTSRRVSGARPCRKRLPSSIRTQIGRGYGSGCSLQVRDTSTVKLARSGGTIFTSP